MNKIKNYKNELSPEAVDVLEKWFTFPSVGVDVIAGMIDGGYIQPDGTTNMKVFSMNLDALRGELALDKAVEQEVLTWASNINEFDSGESVKDKIEQAIDIIVEQDDLAKELAYNEDFVEWWMNKMNHLPPEEREERIGITDDIDYIVAQNWIRNILDNDALKDEWGAFKAQ